MRTTVKAVACGLVAMGLVAVTPAGPAAADPKGDAFTLTCGATTYQITTTRAHGEWTPGFDLNGTQVLIPVSFSNFTGTITGPGGYTNTFTEPGTTVKGSGKQRDVTACTFVFTDTFTVNAAEAAAEGLPGAGTYTFVGSGDVTVQIRGR